MTLERASGGAIDIAAIQDLIEAALLALFRGLAESDAFNRLVLEAGLGWRDVAMVRALGALPAPDRAFPTRRIISPRRSRATARSPPSSSALFYARFDPRIANGASREQAEARDPRRDRGAAAGRHQPRRRPHPAPLRQPRRSGDPHQLLPARGQRPAAPDHRVQVRMREGRGPAAAAGRSTRSSSIRRASRACTCASARSRAAACAGPTGRRISAPRCSGLVKAQQVKNAVIVPVGAKGGFVPKQLPPAERPPGLARGGHRELPHLRPHAAAAHRQHRRRPCRAAAGHRAARRRRSLSRGRGRQGHGDLLRHRQRAVDREGPLARRRLRVRRQPGLRPQEDGHHGPRRLGGGEAPFPRDGHRHPVAARDGGGRRRHVGRRVRQRHAAVAHAEARRGLRPPRHLPRSRSRSGDLVRGARAPVRPAALELAGLRQGADLEGRRHLPAQRQIDSAVAGGPRAARPRQGGGDARRGDERDPASADVGPALVRRHRHLCPRRRRETRRRGRRPRQRRRSASPAARCAPR